MVRLVTIKIFLDRNSFHTLKQSVPPRSNSRLVLDSAVPVGFANVLLTCTETEARNLLRYADHLPKVLASIQQALQTVGRTRENESS
jgi:hypothetical protein